MDDKRKAEIAAYLAARAGTTPEPTPQTTPVPPLPPIENVVPKMALFDERTFRENLPPVMLIEKRFVRYFLQPKEGGGTAKIPLGNHSDKSTWSAFYDCVAALEPGKEQGIGYCFLSGDIHGLDIDHCRNPKTGEICNEAMVLLSRLGSWAEYSVSGQGIHVFFRGNVRGKQLGETCLQYWNPKNSPRFFALTCDMVGEAFTTLKDIGDEFNYIFATARHISAKIREELKGVDYEQWAALPTEREQPDGEPREKAKTKTRKVAKEFDIYDFLKFYGLEIDNETDNDLGHCIRLSSCPIKGEPHVGQNGTTTNFIFPTKDGGLGFHCQSTGCVEYSVAQVIEHLAKDKEPYPGKIYVEEKKQPRSYSVRLLSHTLKGVTAKPIEWIVEGRLPRGMLAYMFAPKGVGKTKLCNHWNKLANDQGFRVIRFNMEDSEDTILKPTLHAAGYNVELTEVVDKSALLVDGEKQLSAGVNFSEQAHIEGLKDLINQFGDVGLVIIEPINNYKGKSKAISEDDMRPIYQNLANLAEEVNISILAVSHKNRKKDVDLQEMSHGAGSSIHVARANWYLQKDKDGAPEDRLLVDAGSNIPVGKSLAFKITQVPPFKLDGVTFDKIAVASNFEDSEVTADEAQEDAESPARKSQANHIAGWLIEFLTGKGDVRTDVVVKAGREFNKEWAQANISQVFSRRFLKKNKGSTHTVGGGKSKITYWSLGEKPLEFDLTKKEAASVKQNDEQVA
jgi:AAA domain